MLDQVEEFGVATGGGVWVAARVQADIREQGTGNREQSRRRFRWRRIERREPPHVGRPCGSALWVGLQADAFRFSLFAVFGTDPVGLNPKRPG